MQNKYQASPSYTHDLEYSISEAKSKGSTWKDIRYSTLKGHTEYDDSNLKDKNRISSDNNERAVDPTVYKDAIKSLRDELTKLRGGPANQMNNGNHDQNLKSEQRTSGKTDEYRERESEIKDTRENPLDMSRRGIDVADKLKIQNSQNQREKIISPKIYKSPNEKDEIDKSYHQEGHSRSSVKSTESKLRYSERNLQNIPNKIAEIERELDDQINRVDDYVVNKNLIRKKFENEREFEARDEEASGHKSNSKSTSEALDSQKKIYKDAFDKNLKRLQEEESKIEYDQTKKRLYKLAKSSEREIEDDNEESTLEPKNQDSKKKNLTELYYETQLSRLRAENDRLNDELDQHLKYRRNSDFKKSSKVWRNQDQEFGSAEEMAQYRNSMNARSKIASDHSDRDHEIRAIAERARSKLRRKLEENEEYKKFNLNNLKKN